MQENSNIFERIMQISDKEGYNSLNDFAKNGLGYKSSEKLNRLKDPKNKPSIDIITDISNKFEDVDLNWLIRGKTKSKENLTLSNGKEKGKEEGKKPNVKKTLPNESITNSITESITNQMYKKGYTSNEDNFIPVLNRLKFAEGIDISSSGAPFYPLPVTAGDNAQFLEVQEEKPTGYISIPGVYCRAFFPVVGFSFEPHIKAGDIIGIDFVDRWERLDPDAIYFIITQDQRMIKRLVDDPENPDKLICISPNFREFSIWKEEIRAIHKVVFYGRLA
ncbi:S24 family peptidase [Riemerella anatipestifer]|nr:S24 family peptidase [Riemerella anatipestifer]